MAQLKSTTVSGDLTVNGNIRVSGATEGQILLADGTYLYYKFISSTGTLEFSTTKFTS